MIMASFADLLAELRPHARIARRCIAQPLQKNSDIQARAADNQWNPPLMMEVVDETAGMAPEEARIEGLVGIDQIDQVVGDAFTGDERGFVGPNIHPTIDLAGVGRQDVAAEPFGDLDRHAAFPNGSRPENDHKRLPADLALGEYS